MGWEICRNWSRIMCEFGRQVNKCVYVEEALMLLGRRWKGSKEAEGVSNLMMIYETVPPKKCPFVQCNATCWTWIRYGEGRWRWWDWRKGSSLCCPQIILLLCFSSTCLKIYFIPKILRNMYHSSQLDLCQVIVWHLNFNIFISKYRN